MSNQQIGSTVLASGIVFCLAGLVLVSDGTSWFGHLPGDMRLERDGVGLFIPVTSMLLVGFGLTYVLRFVFFLGSQVRRLF